jgi:hypothetical protein
LHTRTKFNQIKAEIKQLEAKKEKVHKNLEDDMLSIGLFFLRNIISMISDEANQQKDKDLLLECLRCVRKAFTKTSFRNFFFMFRYLFIKVDLIRTKGTKLQVTLFSKMFERPYLVNIIKDSYERCKRIYTMNKVFFKEPSLSTSIFDFVKEPENHRKTVKELNEYFFGGNECSENMFLSNINEHFKEAIIVYKKMMNLCINFINPQNLSYMMTLTGVDGFNIVMGLLVRLQISIAYLHCWYHIAILGQTENALDGYIDFFKMLQYVDIMCNQAGELLGSSFTKFVDQYYDLTLWMTMYFKRNHPAFYSNIDILLNRTINQVYDIDLSVDQSDNESNSEKIQTEAKNQVFKFYIDKEEQEEIDEQMSSFDIVQMVKPIISKTPDIYDITMFTELLINHPNLSSLLSKSGSELTKVYNKSSSLKLFWQK